MTEMLLTPEHASSAEAIQLAIDSLPPDGGRVILPEMDIVLDRGVELRSNIELVGQGSGTILRKAPGRSYPLSGYHNYGMYDVPLEYTDGLKPGMTVAIRDDIRGGFYETFARITWVDSTWVGLDRGIAADYQADNNPVLLTAFPLVFGRGAENVALRDLALEGNRSEQTAGIGACRGAAVYFFRCHDFEVSGVQERSFRGEGLGFQMSSRGRIRDCSFVENTGNGYHPGAGSTGCLFEGCVSENNDAAGFYFCVRANHITLRDCDFRSNTTCGISVGTRDCNNLIDGCRVEGNHGPGILFRAANRPVEVHSCVISGCIVRGNCGGGRRAQIEIQGDAHDLTLYGNNIAGTDGVETAGIYLAPSTERIRLENNRIENCFPEVIGAPDCLAGERESFECGVETARDDHFRHLFPRGLPRKAPDDT